MSLVAVCDTGPLIHLAAVDSLSLLTLADDCVITETVLAELDDGGRPAALDDLSFTVVTADDDALDAPGLDSGETAAIAVAVELEAVLLTDDLAARERATDLGVEVHGPLGVVALGYSRGRLDRDEAATVMQRLQRETSLFVTDSVVDRGIELLDRE